MNIGIYHGDSEIQIMVAKAFKKGLSGEDSGVVLHDDEHKATFDAIAFYGMSVPHIKMWKEYRQNNKPVFIADLGYFGENRGAGGSGHLKVSVNHWHPTTYFQKFKHLNDRFAKFNIPVKQMSDKRGPNIILAGIGPKSGVLYDMKHQSWDEYAVKEIRKHTDRKIIYRVKPSAQHTFKPIPSTEWSEPTLQLEKLLRNAWAVVSHHSNVAVNGVLEGIPCFVNDGVSTTIGLSDLSMIENPKIISHKEQQQFLADLAYTQWTLDEIASGKTWKHLKSEGLFYV